MRLRSGQTLLELIVAFVVISVGVFGGMSLTLSNLNGLTVDVDQLVAANLAREGVEAAQDLRDSNWLAGNKFDVGLRAGGSLDMTATLTWDPRFQVKPTMDFSTTDMTHPNTVVKDTGGYYYTNDFSSGKNSVYRRLLTFQSICQGSSGGVPVVSFADDHDCAEPIDSTAIGNKIGVRVVSTVQWTRGVSTRNFSVSLDLYDWK